MDPMDAAVAHHRAGRLQEAAAGYVAVLNADPEHADALHLLGLVMHRLGHSAEALDLMDRALAVDRRLAAAHANRGMVLRSLDRLDDAAESLRRALRLRDDLSEARLNLARVEHSRGMTSVALIAARRARTARPSDPEALGVLVICLMADGAVAMSEGRGVDAIHRYAEAVCAVPGERPSAVALADAVAASAEVPDDIQDALLVALSVDGVDHQRLDRAARAALRSLRDDPSALTGAALFAPWLSNVIVRDPDWERALAATRAHLLEALEPAEAIEAVARHGFHSEYVWAVSDAERARLATLDADHPAHGMYGGYDPGWTDEEAALAETLEELTDDHATSTEVRAMYEAHPYPRLVGVQVRERLPLATALAAVLPGVELPSEPVQVLVAGAGTGQHPLTTATAWDCEVLAVDLSRASLARALRNARRLEIDTVRFVRGDVMQLGQLDRAFDVVESVGVLHHLDDPLAGWRVLVDCVRPGGWMRIGLYAERGRSDVVAARAFVAEHGFAPTDEGIRAARQALLALPEDHPAHPIVWSPDFTSVTGCRDLVFHVREHRYTLPRLKAELEELGLSFLGFQHANPAVPALYRERWPADRGQVDLDRWETLEAEHVRIFSGMYVLWCQRPA